MIIQINRKKGSFSRLPSLKSPGLSDDGKGRAEPLGVQETRRVQGKTFGLLRSIWTSCHNFMLNLGGRGRNGRGRRKARESVCKRDLCPILCENLERQSLKWDCLPGASRQMDPRQMHCIPLYFQQDVEASEQFLHVWEQLWVSFSWE